MTLSLAALDDLDQLVHRDLGEVLYPDRRMNGGGCSPRHDQLQLARPDSVLVNYDNAAFAGRADFDLGPLGQGAEPDKTR